MKKDDDAEFHKPQCNLFKPHLKTRNKYPRLLIASLSKCWACETLFSVFFVLWIQNYYGQAGETAWRVKPMLCKCEELRMNLQTPHKYEYAYVSAFQCSKGNMGGETGNPQKLKSDLASTHGSEQQKLLISQRKFKDIWGCPLTPEHIPCRVYASAHTHRHIRLRAHTSYIYIHTHTQRFHNSKQPLSGESSDFMNCITCSHLWKYFLEMHNNFWGLYTSVNKFFSCSFSVTDWPFSFLTLTNWTHRDTLLEDLCVSLYNYSVTHWLHVCWS